ncbi:UDP-N-acetylmuramoyl-tripeptide--D-alanyl-D-alanine ligase [Hymenobacter sp. BT186]|uniref:UDP-N-acetylmuramoyl-tripeptide--D-alanyl-D-alanine ligase n=1 Tax=Hymenobacter telluris TaxID=2816474 RepID=A0A939J7N8_9BACT|nr:UDP-N-acetylmuramoyl-tripeptide--D-alanyl-D-alanine ligase [Hymenobacter telluris]MBO0356919.1 UDP-N-acetylmuramoyl-tripeptide--D-alanyl-D-alanine ligase [Hymenobacter telluris]MBW3372946.1 UDP-N-acetylmuramoyl-tripeptide--D-alanyl-D-alanine ligase [Hymenobacter norwichensis]
MQDIAALYEQFRASASVSTDSRQPQMDTLFFALNGPSFRGADFAAQALAQGARHAVVDDAALAATAPARYTYVPDPLLALQELARYHRRQLTMPVLAVTGSNGKTTTKELINSVLSRRFRVQYTRGNLNNHIGVPLTLLGIRPDEHELAIVEMGANHQGEIALLSSIAEPTHGLITNIGKAHLEGFGGQEGIAKGKAELFQFLATAGGTAFVNTLDARLPGLAEVVPQRVSYPAPTDTYPATFVGATPNITLRLADNTLVEAQITGDYNFPNLAAAAAVGQHFGVHTADIAAALAEYAPTNNRSQLVQTGRNEVILDAYNANPSSMAAALRSFAARPGTSNDNKVVILGDMFELGDESAGEHAELGHLLADLPFGTVVLIGPEMRLAHAAFGGAAHYFATKAEVADWLQAQALQGRQILIKGSRGMGLETLLTLV